MPKYQVTAPDGKSWEVSAPEGATEAQVLAFAQSQWQQPAQAPQAQPDNPVVQAIKNIPGSAMKFREGIAQTVMHPVDTASGLFDAAAGGLRNISPEFLRSVIDKADTTPQAQAAQARATSTADAIGGHFKDRYGGAGAIGRTLVEDPVGTAADLSTLFTGGAMAAGRLPAVSGGLNKAAQYTNPLSVVAPAVRGVGSLAKNVAGYSTGVGAENIAQAARSGYKGGTDAFLANMTGKAPMTDVIDSAKVALDSMAREKSAIYRKDMAAVSADKSILNFDGIDDAISKARELTSYKGKTTNTKAGAAVQQMADDVTEWKALDPKEFHTPEGLDALKKRLGGVLESIPFEEKTARLAAGKVYDSVKSEITKQAPTYAKTMKEYADLSDEISQIERALSLGKKASTDTTLRKLQSLARNNANTNYGNRLDMAKILEGKGGVELMPAIAGQALSSAAPRGLTHLGATGAAGGLAASTMNPGWLALLAAQSPKLVGSAAYGGGRVAGAAGRGMGLLGINPDRAKMAGLLAAELGREPQPKDW